MIKFTIELPCPPSANTIWRNVKGRTLKSKPYRTWLRVCDPILWNAYKDYEMITGPCAVWIEYQPSTGNFKDLDNVAKPILDLLQKAEVIENDRFVEILNLKRLQPKKGTNTVTISVLKL